MASAFKRTGIRQPDRERAGEIPPDMIGTRMMSYDGVFRPSFRYPPFSLDKLTAQKGYDTADDMFTLAACRAPFNLKRSAILSEGWEVVPAVTDPYDSRYEEAKTYADFATAVLTDIRVPENDLVQDFRSVLWQVMRGIWNGFSVAEIGYRVLEEGANAGKLGYDGIYLKRPRQIGFDLNPATMQILHLTSYTPGLGLLPGERILPANLHAGYDFTVPVSKCLLYTHDPDANLPHGNGDWRGCYKHWWAIDNVLRFWAVAIERWGAPVLIAQADPTDATAWGVAQQVLDTIRQSASTMLPEGIKYELVNAPVGLWEGFRLTVDWHARQIALNIQHSTLAMYEGEHGATSAGSATHKDASEYLYNACRRDIEGVINSQLLRRLIAYNFPDFDPALCPRLSLGGDDPGDVLKLAQAYDLLIKDGVIGKSARFLRESLGMPPMDPDEQAAIEAEAKAAQEAAAQIADARNSGKVARMSDHEYSRALGTVKEALLALDRLKAERETASWQNA